MRTRILQESSGERVIAAVFETGDEVMPGLEKLAAEESLTGARITGIGAFSEVTLRYFDWERKEYRDIPINEQVEVASLVGDIGVGPAGEPAIHIHLVVGRRDGTALAGHLGSALVRPTLELMISETPDHLRRRKDPESGLNLIRL